MPAFEALLTNTWSVVEDFSFEAKRQIYFNMKIDSFENQTEVQLTWHVPTEYLDPEDVPVDHSIPDQTTHDIDNRPMRGVLYGRTVEPASVASINISYW